MGWMVARINQALPPGSSKPGHARRGRELSPRTQNFVAIHRKNRFEPIGFDGGFDESSDTVGEDDV